MMVDANLHTKRRLGRDVKARQMASGVAHMSGSASQRLFEKMDEVWRAEFAQGDQLLISRLDGVVKDLLSDSGKAEN